MQKHIADALQSHSQAICNTLDRYNNAAKALIPPQRLLDWEDVVEYAFLADFDLLHDTRQDICSFPWATPAARAAIDQYFKILCAHEEIQWLNVEIPHVITYIRDEDTFLRGNKAQIRLTHPSLAHQVMLHRRERGCFNQYHLSAF
jgi:hypothetical protein